jgi:hypothetical protein
MRTHNVLLGLMATVLATVALAQTAPPSTPSSATPAPGNSTAPMPSNGGADQSAGAKEQQSQKQPCTGNDHSNVNCKQKTGNSQNNTSPNNTGTNPK